MLLIYITIGYPVGQEFTAVWTVLNKVSRAVDGTTTPSKQAKELRKDVAERPWEYPMAIGVRNPSELFYEVYEHKTNYMIGDPSPYKLIAASDNAPNQPTGG